MCLSVCERGMEEERREKERREEEKMKRNRNESINLLLWWFSILAHTHTLNKQIDYTS